MCRLLPGARELLAMPALASSPDAVPVVVSESLVESAVIQSSELGIAIILVNWSPQPLLDGLTVTLGFDVPWLHDGFASLASGRSLVVTRAQHPHASRAGPSPFDPSIPDVPRFTLDLHVSDAIILRKGNVRGVS